VLKILAPKSDARHVHLRGYDLSPNATTPAFVRSIPIDRAMDPTTLLAFKMNDEPLPLQHGGPVRLVVPGWTGNHWMKWLSHLELAEREAEGFYMDEVYRVPAHPVAPGEEEADPGIPVTTNPIKSIITRPLDGSRLETGAHLISGIALTGIGVVQRVEVSFDAGRSWNLAELQKQKSPGAWQPWRYRWRVDTPGNYSIAVRATDSEGRTQPGASAWNRRGYLWNGIDRVRCEVA
jgi:sulfite oxidase